MGAVHQQHCDVVVEVEVGGGFVHVTEALYRQLSHAPLRFHRHQARFTCFNGCGLVVLGFVLFLFRFRVATYQIEKKLQTFS